MPGKPADKAGIKPGDTIVRVDNVPVKDTRDLIGYVSGQGPGQQGQARASSATART